MSESKTYITLWSNSIGPEFVVEKVYFDKAGKLFMKVKRDIVLEGPFNLQIDLRPATGRHMYSRNTEVLLGCISSFCSLKAGETVELRYQSYDTWSDDPSWGWGIERLQD